MRWCRFSLPRRVGLVSRNIIEVLSLGQNFATSKQSRDTGGLILKNCRTSDEDLQTGFIQGVAFICDKLVQQNESNIPARYMKALLDLKKDENIIITKADKGGA